MKQHEKIKKQIKRFKMKMENIQNECLFGTFKMLKL